MDLDARVELVAAIDQDGKPLQAQYSRTEAHRKGIWHRSVSIFVLNRYGEILIERRSDHKDLFPGFYDIVGGHLQPGQKPVDAARQEISEEIGLSVPSSRLEPLTQEDAVIEHVVLPDHAIINLERKTIYLLQLTQFEEKEVRHLAARLLRLTSDELYERGTSGEVSQIEFWAWERLRDLSRSRKPRPLASGTLSAMNDDLVRDAVSRHCLALRNACREAFVRNYAFLSEGQPIDDTYDRRLFERFLERPGVAAPAEQVNAIFNDGPNQLAGAYELGPFRQAVSGDDYWEPKLRDPEKRYVTNLLMAIGFSQDAQIQQQLERMTPEIQSFVTDLLNFPLMDGRRFRDNLGNLADIAAARKAVLIWLEQAALDLPIAETLDYPTRIVTKACLQAGFNILYKFFRSKPRAELDCFRNLVLLGLGASSADFNSPAFQRHLKAQSMRSVQIARFLEQKTAREFSEELGGDCFLSEFYSKFVESCEPVTIAYLTGNAAQASISLAIAQEILRLNRKAKVRFVPKSGSPGNDLTLEGAQETIAVGRQGVFSDLVRFIHEGRFTVEPDGPQGHGLDPGKLSANVTRVLAEAQVILAEGQAYAEIRGWKKPTYIAFRVNGRVAEAIHGISRYRGASGFVRLTPGVDHFQDFQAAIRRTIVDAENGRTIRAAAQTTSEYVRAVLSENLDLIVNQLFQGNHLEACQQLEAEAERLGKTFAQVIIGAASESPDSAQVPQVLRDTRFPVFACGGGGGFSSVTLRALRMLGLPVAAGVPSTDDGGSTGELQRWLRNERGFVFGVGDMAAILQDQLPHKGKRALLAYRFDIEPESLPAAIMERIVAETLHPTYPDSPIGAADDFLSFVCNQLNLARVIETSFREGQRSSKLPIKGASIRNLNVIAAYELCGMLGDQLKGPDESRLAAFCVLQKALGLPPDLLVIPVTYAESVLFLEYEDPVPQRLSEVFAIPEEALGCDRRRLYGQQYIDKLPQVGSRSTVGVVKAPDELSRPSANPEYLKRIREAELFVMGAGSLVGSQLSQLVVPGVVDILLERVDMRRVLVLNHVKMDETLGMSVRDQIRLIENAATENASPDLLDKHARNDNRLRISDLFTDIIVPRTIAREIEAEMLKRNLPEMTGADDNTDFVSIHKPGSNQTMLVFCNKYVKFLIDNPEIREHYGVTIREIEVLSYLDQPRTLYDKRSEKGRYRGALFATAEDIDYLVDQGIQRRSIHEVDSIGENWKFVKAEGSSSLEFFPGLVPEGLVGIFRIALERARATSASTR